MGAKGNIFERYRAEVVVMRILIFVILLSISSVVYAQGEDGQASKKETIEISPPTREYFKPPSGSENAEDLARRQMNLQKKALAPVRIKDWSEDTPVPQKAPKSVGDPAVEESKEILSAKQRMQQIKNAYIFHAKKMMEICPAMWSNTMCLKDVTDTFQTAQAIYKEELDLHGFYDEIEMLNNSCGHALMVMYSEVVTTDYMINSYADCSNTFYEIYERTNIEVDKSLQRLMLISVECLLDAGPRCEKMVFKLKSELRGFESK